MSHEHDEGLRADMEQLLRTAAPAPRLAPPGSGRTRRRAAGALGLRWRIRQRFGQRLRRRLQRRWQYDLQHDPVGNRRALSRRRLHRIQPVAQHPHRQRRRSQRHPIQLRFGQRCGRRRALMVTLEIVSAASSCAALSGYAVYLWHCTRDGNYSMYSTGITAENYLRGVQVSGSDGKVSFTTIFPGCYAGRWPHIHFEVYGSQALATSTPASDYVKVSQLALPEATCRSVYAAPRATAPAPATLTGSHWRATTCSATTPQRCRWPRSRATPRTATSRRCEWPSEAPHDKGGFQRPCAAPEILIRLPTSKLELEMTEESAEACPFRLTDAAADCSESAAFSCTERSKRAMVSDITFRPERCCSVRRSRVWRSIDPSLRPRQRRFEWSDRLRRPTWCHAERIPRKLR